MVPINRLKDARTEAVQHAAFAVPLIPKAVVPLAKIDTGNVAENGIKSRAEVSVVSTCKQIAIRMRERTIVGGPRETKFRRRVASCWWRLGRQRTSCAAQAGARQPIQPSCNRNQTGTRWRMRPGAIHARTVARCGLLRPWRDRRTGDHPRQLPGPARDRRLKALPRSRGHWIPSALRRIADPQCAARKTGSAA